MFIDLQLFVHQYTTYLKIRILKSGTPGLVFLYCVDGEYTSNTGSTAGFSFLEQNNVTFIYTMIIIYDPRKHVQVTC